jgi:hypothetical protein
MIHPNLVVKNSHSSFDIFLGLAPTMTKKSNKNPMAGAITWTTKGKVEERPKRSEAGRNEGREKASPFHGKELSHLQPL